MDTDGPAAASDLDPIVANRFRALVTLPITIFVILGLLGLAWILASGFFESHQASLTTLSVGIAIEALAFASIGVGGLVWRFAPAFLETAAAERLRRMRISPHAYALSIAWSGFVVAVPVALGAVVTFRTDPQISIVPSMPHFTEIAGTVAVISFAPITWVMIQGWRRRRDHPAR